jgi:hypothetical protein
LGAAAKVATIIIVLFVLFFFVPLVYYSSTNSAGTSTATVSVIMSPSFYVLGCGTVLNLQGTGEVLGVQVSQSGFFCAIGAAR